MSRLAGCSDFRYLLSRVFYGFACAVIDRVACESRVFLFLLYVY